MAEEYKKSIFYYYNLPSKIESEEQLERTILTSATEFLKYHNKHITLTIVSWDISTFANIPDYIFITIKTNPAANHPYIAYSAIGLTYIGFLAPLGKDYGQVDSININYVLSACNKFELFLLYLLHKKTIDIRKLSILTSSQYSLLQCDMITNCRRKMRDIAKNVHDKSKRELLTEHYSQYYLKKAVEFLKLYFNLLEAQDFAEAQLFLKGGGNDKYFGKQRLNTFFSNSKDLVGHLQVFIYLYQDLYKIYGLLY